MSKTNICEFEIVGREGIPETYLALDGYRHENGDVSLHFVPEGSAPVFRALPFVLRLTDEQALRTGNERIAFQHLLESVSEGTNFGFKGMTYTRMTANEVREIAQGQQFRDSQAPEAPGLPTP
jgi:hypothetical protein